MSSERSLTRFALQLHSAEAAERDEAARQIWLYFSDRLLALVRRRLDPALRVRAAEDDVLQSVFASFFNARPAADRPVRDRAEIWRLLVCLTMRRIANTADHHRAQRRDVRRERRLEPHGGASAVFNGPPCDPGAGRSFDPQDEVIAREQFERLLATLPDDLKQIFAMRLEGYTNAEIASQVNRVERTIELKMNALRGRLRSLLQADSDLS